MAHIIHIQVIYGNNEGCPRWAVGLTVDLGHLDLTRHSRVDFVTQKSRQLLLDARAVLGPFSPILTRWNCRGTVE